jgi:hypothetical protein
MPGSRSGEVAGKAPGIVQVVDQRFAHEHAGTHAESLGHGPEIVIPVLRDGAQARDEVLIKDTRNRLLDASGASRSWLPC